MATLSPSTLLDTWDAGARRHPVDRAVLLLALTREDAADVPLGRRNRELMRLRRERFGDRLSVWVDCGGCGERMSLELAADDLPEAPGAEPVVEVDGHRFRAPTSRDLAGLAGAPDAAAAVRLLLRACAADPDALPQGGPLDALIPAVEAALDDADPWVDLTLAAECPACGHRQEAMLDVPGLLWDEIEATAHGLLDQVHALAAAYGWSERQILSLGPARRAAYLSRIGA